MSVTVWQYSWLEIEICKLPINVTLSENLLDPKGNFVRSHLSFIARQHSNADARYWYSNSVRLSVCPSVRPSRHAAILYRNGLTCFLQHNGNPIILTSTKHLCKIPTPPPIQKLALNTCGVYKFRDFYRATRMHSAHYAVARCLSVCHTPVLSLNGYTYPRSFFIIG